MNLLIGWNAWSVLEYLMTGEKVEDTYWRFKCQYYIDLEPSWIAEPFKKYEGQKVDKVFMPSSMVEEDKEFVKQFGIDKLYYLEEGEYDYNKYKDDDKHFKCPFYSMNPDKIANKDVFSEIRQLVLNNEVSEKFLSLYDVWLPKDEYDIILYTDPLDKDCGINNVKEIVEDYMQKHHAGKRILVKAHPRDTINWGWDICSHRVPAQLLLARDVIHIFMFKTTVMRYLHDHSKVEEIDIKGYC